VRSFRYERAARHRAALAALVGGTIVIVSGPLVVVPALAFVALVYYLHHVVAATIGDDDVPNVGLAFVVVINAAVVLFVQAVVFVEGLRLET
jgi:hypothetical protein